MRRQNSTVVPSETNEREKERVARSDYEEVSRKMGRREKPFLCNVRKHSKQTIRTKEGQRSCSSVLLREWGN